MISTATSLVTLEFSHFAFSLYFIILYGVQYAPPAGGPRPQGRVGRPNAEKRPLASRPAALRAGILREVSVAGCEPIFGLIRLRPRSLSRDLRDTGYTCMRVGSFLTQHPSFLTFLLD